MKGAEQAARLAVVIARTGLDPWDAHMAAVADAAICPILTLDAANWRQYAERLDEPQRIAPLMMTGGGMTETQARVAANALVFGYFGALEQWYLDGGVHPVAQYVEEGMLPLRGIWSRPDGSGSL